MTRGRGNALNLRYWPRTVTQFRPTQVRGPGDIAGVLTTIGVIDRAVTAKNTPLSVLTTVAVASSPGVVKYTPTPVVTTVAVYPSTSSLRSANTAVLTTLGGHTETQSLREALISALTTLGAETSVILEVLSSHAVAVLTTIGGHTVAAIVHRADVASLTTAGADTAASAAHDVAVTATTTAAATTAADGVHNAFAGVETTVGAHSASVSIREAIVAALTTGAAWSWASIDDLAHRIDVLTTAGIAQALTTTRNTDIASDVGVAVGIGVETARYTPTGSVVTVAASTEAGIAAHDIAVTASTTIGVSADTASFKDLSVPVLTTGAASTGWLNVIVQLCVDLLAEFDTVLITVEADTVAIGIEECAPHHFNAITDAVSDDDIIPPPPIGGGP